MLCSKEIEIINTKKDGGTWHRSTNSYTSGGTLYRFHPNKLHGNSGTVFIFQKRFSGYEDAEVAICGTMIFIQKEVPNYYA